MERKKHWENVFATKQETEVSWYQNTPKTSIQFFINHKIPKDAKIIDIGGGDSYLIDSLLNLGYTNLYLLDISENAINRIKKRLGKKANQVTFIVSDILDFEPENTFDVWHDRASFHFLISKDDIIKYNAIVTHAINKNGYLFMGTFSEKGPIKCSGLEISQYNQTSIDSVFKDDFNMIDCFNEDHKTPFDTIQNFIFCCFNKK